MRVERLCWRGLFFGALFCALLPWSAAQAVRFDLGGIYGNEFTGSLNSTLTAGVGVRMSGRNADLVGKSNLNPNVCAPPYQSCQGLFRTQNYPAAHLAAAPGAPSVNFDDGDVNYDKHDIFQAPMKATEELTLKWGNFGFFGRILYFHDLVNDDFTEHHPNRITAQNYQQVGRETNVVDFAGANGLSHVSQTLSPLTGSLGQLGQLIGGILNGTTGAVNGVVGAGLPIRVYGPGGNVRNERDDSSVLSQAGSAFQYLDSFVYGRIPMGRTNVMIKIGRQTLNWGESTELAINSINVTNPINVNNYYRIGGEIEEVFTPINMAFVSFSPFSNATLEGYYQLEWQPDEIPAPGTYFSFVDLGTKNAGIRNGINAGFGGTAEDPDCKGSLLDNPLALITPTCATIPRLPDWAPRTSGQFGFHFDYWASQFNNGTDFGLYYEHYHARLPYISFFATYPSCARAEGNALHVNANDTAEFAAACPDLPLVRALTGGNPAQGTSSAVPFDTARIVLEYPEDIDLFGLSFNTTVGNYAIQGEVAYRPNKPFQIDPVDLAFAAFGPTLSRCGQPGTNCLGTVGGVGQTESGGTMVYPPGDFQPYPGQTAYKDTFDLLVGNLPGSQRAFPNFVVPYRGGQVGNNAPCYPKPGSAEEAATGFNGFSHPYYAYNSSSPCYIRGYQRFQDLNFNFGATRVLGQTDNWVGANQVILLYEFGAEWVVNMPSYDRLVLAGPTVATYGPTAGADGSHTSDQRMNCSNIPDCNYGPDGGRFNPHQADRHTFPTAFSWGYRVIALLEYDQFILPEVTLKPLIQWHQDVGGRSPGPAGNFISGRKEVDALFTFQYRSHFSVNLGYKWYWGGGATNYYADRDFAQGFLKYTF